MKKSLLYISYYFPPIKSIAVKRNYFLAMGLRKYFEEVQILTTTNHKLVDQEKVSLDGLNIVDLPTFDYRTILAKFKKGKSIHFSESYKKSWFIPFLIKLNETFPVNLFFGEGGLRYIYHGFKYGKKYLSSKDEKYIFTSYRPFANVFIGYMLKKKFKDAVWIINFHDFPIDGIRSNVLLPGLQRWIWEKMLNYTNHNLTVSKGLEKHIGGLTSKVTTVMNGVVVRKSNIAINKKFKLVYTGSLYHNLGNPDIFFHSISLMINSGTILESNVEIIYAGKDSISWMQKIQLYGLTNIAVDMGEVNTKVAQSLQDAAHINLLITWATIDQSGVITGKFYEYLGSTNPILTIINGCMDYEIFDIFQALNCGKVIATNDPEAMNEIISFITEKYQAWKNKTSFPSYASRLKALNWENQIKELANIICH